MKTVPNDHGLKTLLRAADREVLRRIAMTFAPLVKVEPPLGSYRTMTREAVWWALAGQVCVMGSAGHWERAQASSATSDKFKKALSLSVVATHPRIKSYLEDTLREFSATHFPRKAAAKLAQALRTQTVFRNGRVALFRGLTHNDDPAEVRDKLVKRCPIFRLKSASDFMISVGLSHDVIALDTRIISTLRACCGFDHTSERVQSSRDLYLSVEPALREFCREQRMSLALLDRLLFQFSNLSAVELVARYPRFTSGKAKAMQRVPNT